MTLTDIMPSLRTMQADPLNLDRWPARTRSTPTDVVAAGISLVQLAGICGTPCTHSAAAVVPGTRGIPSATDVCTTLVVTVSEVKRHPTGRLLIRVDGDLTAVDSALDEVRLIGRVSTKHDRESFLIIPDGLRRRVAPFLRLPAGLPGDLAQGDLLAVPCPAMVTLHDVRVP